MSAGAKPLRPPAPVSADPLAAIAGFAGSLRDHGFGLGIAEQQAMVRAALALPLERWTLIEACWRAIACQDRRDWQQWPELFQRYWFPHRVRGSTRVSGQTRPSRSLQQLVQNLHDSMAPGAPRGAPADSALQAAAAQDEDSAGQRAQGGASRTEALHDRSLAQWLPQDLARLEQLAGAIARRLRRQLTRRWRDDPHGRRLDLRRTLRASLRTGGLPLQPVWRAPRREWPRLFILVDVSRSMETHAQLFLRIARAFVAAMDARVFVFHTRLAEVTSLLRCDSATIQQKVNAVTAGFGGGTCIATSVADFRCVHARAQLGRRARVWLLSDGFDADPPERLAEELVQVRKRGARISWFHPAARIAGGQALDQVRTVPGLVEHYCKLDSLRDLASLAQHLN